MPILLRRELFIAKMTLEDTNEMPAEKTNAWQAEPIKCRRERLIEVRRRALAQVRTDVEAAPEEYTPLPYM